MRRIVGALLLAACAVDENEPVQLTETIRQAANSCNGPTPAMRYLGGPVLQNAQVVQVNWSSSVNSQIKTTLPAFFKDLVHSPWMDMLSEYGTIGHSFDGGTTRQAINRGALIGSYTIDPTL